MSGYTKGTWEYEWKGYDYTEGTVSSGDKLIAIVAGSNYGEWRDAEDSGESEFQANARLIAAAPELLGALELFVKLRDEGMSNDYYMMRDAVEAARKTIAKARGEA